MCASNTNKVGDYSSDLLIVMLCFDCVIDFRIDKEEVIDRYRPIGWDDRLVSKEQLK